MADWPEERDTSGLLDTLHTDFTRSERSKNLEGSITDWQPIAPVLIDRVKGPWGSVGRKRGCSLSQQHLLGYSTMIQQYMAILYMGDSNGTTL
ncbi:hypothetical protein WN51_02240 [Melipona quadrifasciata]|uniref:Uncharacterized protein n=1 Tax=Melipona quadrifasciata TaxID=166423 RepID=A0A0M8ZVF4_9HYME|nr:hypothetical protein WN51_02240 [Melipona quadrifasciata]